jgi:hypothetical protein
MINCPIYRAKKIDSNEYIEFESKVFAYGKMYAVIYNSHDVFVCSNKSDVLKPDNIYCKLIEIDPSTLAIHFEDMVANDSDRLLPNGEKDLRIFASLSEDGKGGDLCIYADVKFYNPETIMKFNGNTLIRTMPNHPTNFSVTVSDLKVTGIQE